MLIQRILHAIGHTLSLLLPPGKATLMGKMLDHIYTGYHRRRFGSLAPTALLRYPADALEGLEHIHIGGQTAIGAHARLTSWAAGGTHAAITIGDHCSLGAHTHLTAACGIAIGSGFLCGTNVLISDNAHGLLTPEGVRTAPIDRPLSVKGPVKIGRNVWVGNNVCILSGVTIGDNVIVGANSVVTHDIPANSMAAGSPATIIKQLND